MRNVSELITLQRNQSDYKKHIGLSEEVCSSSGNIFFVMKENVLNNFQSQDLLLKGYCEKLNIISERDNIVYFDVWVNFVIISLLELKSRCSIYKDIKAAIGLTPVLSEDYYAK